MKTIYADYNAATEAGHICLTTVGSREDIERAGLEPGDWAWLSDTEVIIGAQLALDGYYGLVGIPDWDTLIHLDDEDVRRYETVANELIRLLGKSRRSHDEERRILQLLTAIENLTPRDDANSIPPGYFASRRAETLELLGKPELALLEIEEARRLGSTDPDDDFLYLGILRRLDLPRARREAEAFASDTNAPAAVLAECINVMATHADDLPDDQFQAVAEHILAWADRFDRAPGREEVTAPTLALLQFNRGMTLLRLGRVEAAREALRLARAVDPIFPGIDEAARLTAYDQQARALAARGRARSTAA
jgi:tetratricopeptide (TPR) repeat protein